MTSSALGVQDPTTIILMKSDEFQMFADIRISNTFLSTQTNSLIDMSIPPKQIPLSMSINEMIDFGKFQNLLSAVVTTGKLADGNYTFRVTIRSGQKGSLSISDDIMETVQVISASTLNLISPGGELSDSLQNIVFSPYPIFQWETNPCQGCESFIRVAKFESDSDKEFVTDSIIERWFSKNFILSNFNEIQVYKNMLNTTSIKGYIECCEAIKEADLSLIHISEPTRPY